MHIRTTSVLAALFVFSAAQAQSESDISGDVTFLSESMHGRKAEVVIMSAMVSSGEVIADSEPGQFPDSVRAVRSIKISVNGSKVFVPHSCFADLVWVSKASLTIAKSGGVLAISGGDASESYTAKIVFGRNAVRSRSLVSNEFPDHPTERTQYFQNVNNGK